MAIIGAILGDIIGSRWEFHKPPYINYKEVPLFSKECCFTDDTVLTLATKYALDNNIPFAEAYKKFGRKYSGVGYGDRFEEWLRSDSYKAYNSYGNGSAMRVSPIIEAATSLGEVIGKARDSAVCTHNHPEGVKGAVVTAVCGYLAKQGASKAEIYGYAKAYYSSDEYVYSVDTTMEELQENYRWSETCQSSVPVAIVCFLNSNSYEGFIRNVLSLDCDADTLCAIGGAIAEEFYKTTGFDNEKLLKEYLSDELYEVLKAEQKYKKFPIEDIVNISKLLE